MGWFSNLWDSIKSTASDVWSGVKNVASTVYDTVSAPVRYLGKGLEYASKIPVLGGLLAPVKAAVGTATNILDQGKAVGDVVKAIGLKMGGVVSKRMFQKAE
tara:strand:+ start:9222 stop:9527 length:306 start_codon:yes stop_codon:yes gene_type:complete